MVLVRKHRVVRQTQLLGAFDFSVPIRPLDQAAHQAYFVFSGHHGDVLDQLQGAGLVGLHGQAKAGPLRMLLRHQGHQSLKYFQRQLQPVHLFSVNRQVDIGSGSRFAKAPDAGHQFVHYALALRVFVARVQSAELDGNTIV